MASDYVRLFEQLIRRADTDSRRLIGVTDARNGSPRRTVLHRRRNRARRPHRCACSRMATALRCSTRTAISRRRHRASRGSITAARGSCRAWNCSSAAAVRCCSTRRSARTTSSSPSNLTNPDILRDGRVIVPRGEIHILRSRVLWNGGYSERVRVSNHSLHPIEIPIALFFDADYADEFEARGAVRPRRGQRLPDRRGHDYVLGYVGLDGVRATHDAALESAAGPG